MSWSDNCPKEAETIISRKFISTYQENIIIANTQNTTRSGTE